MNHRHRCRRCRRHSPRRRRRTRRHRGRHRRKRPDQYLEVWSSSRGRTRIRRRNHWNPNRGRHRIRSRCPWTWTRIRRRGSPSSGSCPSRPKIRRRSLDHFHRPSFYRGRRALNRSPYPGRCRTQLLCPGCLRTRTRRCSCPAACRGRAWKAVPRSFRRVCRSGRRPDRMTRRGNLSGRDRASTPAGTAGRPYRSSHRGRWSSGRACRTSGRPRWREPAEPGRPRWPETRSNRCTDWQDR